MLLGYRPLLTMASAETSGAGRDQRSGQVELIQNEVLCYIFDYVNKSTVDMLVKTIVDFYTPGEIQEARETLWKEYSGIIPESTYRFRTSKASHHDVVAACRDLVQNGILLIFNGGLMKTNVKFCAVMLHRIPRLSPEECSMQSVLARLAKLENNVCATQAQVAENTNAIKGKVHTDNATKPDARSEKPSYSDVTAQHPVITQKVTAVPDEGWTQQWDQRRKQVRQAASQKKVVTGRHDEGILKSAQNVKDIFVFNVSNECGEGEIMEALKSKNITVHVVRTVSHKQAYRRSFKVTIKVDDLDTVMADDFWATGIKCREWILNRDINNGGDV